MCINFEPYPGVLNQSEILSDFDQRPLFQRVIDSVAAFFIDFADALYSGFKMASECCVSYELLKERFEWKQDSKGLIILVHGLMDRPTRWDGHVRHLKGHDEIDIYTPAVAHLGLCSIDEASEKIVETALEYATLFPNRKICVIGHSNGSRIADKIDIALREKSPQTVLKISTIAGVHFGSTWMNIGKMLGLHHIILRGNPLWDEMAYGSDKAIEILEGIKAPLAAGVKREYEFYATTEDLLVPKLGSSIPVIEKGERRVVVHGVGHISIVSKVAKEQMENAIKWINE